MCRLSIVVPCLNDTTEFENTLVSVLENRPSQCEVLVVHFDHYEDPYDLGSEVRFVEAPELGVLAAFNAGIKSSRGKVVHTLCPSVLAKDGWVDPVLDWFEDDRIGSVAPLILQSEDSERIASAGLCYSTGGRRINHGANVSVRRCRGVLRKSIVGPNLAAGFYRRSVIESLGGFASHVGPHNADVDIAMSMKAIGQRCVLESDSIVTGPKSLFTKAVPSIENGRFDERLFWRHAPGASWAAAISTHALTIAGSVLANAIRAGGYSQLIGRILGGCEFKSRRQYKQQLKQLAEDLSREAENNSARAINIEEYHRSERDDDPMRRAA